jgi:hypothetical protein
MIYCCKVCDFHILPDIGCECPIEDEEYDDC